MSQSESADDRLLHELQAAQGTRPLLVRGATLLTMDGSETPILPAGDLLVEHGAISRLAPSIDDAPPDAIVIDAAGQIVMPGFVDGHRHCWQGAFRRLAVDADLSGYLAITHDGVARHFRPEDMYIGNLVSLLGAIDAGFTTVLDLSHNSRSAAHADAVFESYRESGIRAVHASAPPNAGEWEEHWPADLDRLAALCDSDDLVTLRAALDLRRVAPDDEVIAQARRLGVGIHVDGVMGAGSAREIRAFADAGLLGPDVTFVHATSLDTGAWQAIEHSGARVVLAVASDGQLGLAGAVSPLREVVDAGLRVGLSVDVEICLPGDPFSLMRSTLLAQRTLAFAMRSPDREPRLLSHRTVLEWATLGGAEASGLGAVTGSLEVGKRADFLIVSANGMNSIPGGNPIGTVVQGSDRSSIRAVFIDGVVRKWNGELLGVDVARLSDDARASRDRLLGLAGITLDVTGVGGGARLGDTGLRSYLASHEEGRTE